MTKDKTPETAEEIKAKIYDFLNDISPTGNGIRSRLESDGLIIHIVEWIYRFSDLQTSLLQKENEAKQQLLDEMAEALKELIETHKWLWENATPGEITASDYFNKNVNSSTNAENVLLIYKNQKEGK